MLLLSLTMLAAVNMPSVENSKGPTVVHEPAGLPYSCLFLQKLKAIVSVPTDSTVLVCKDEGAAKDVASLNRGAWIRFGGSHRPSVSGPWVDVQLVAQLNVARMAGQKEVVLSSRQYQDGMGLVLNSVDSSWVRGQESKAQETERRLDLRLGSMTVGWCKRWGRQSVVLGIRMFPDGGDATQGLFQWNISLEPPRKFFTTP